jgi:hypothetical protein
MKVFAIVSIARQVQGEYVVCKIEKAFTSSSKASEYANSLARQYAETIQTPNGPIPCVCERGVFEIDVVE